MTQLKCNVQDASMGVLGYYLFGWAFAYGENQSCDADGVCTDIQNGFIGSTQFAMHDLVATSYHTWFFQYVFAISTATIVSGAVAERVTMLTYMLCESHLKFLPTTRKCALPS